MNERFAGNCSDICNAPNISDSLRAVCDTGSQQYCSTANNIVTPNCKAYLTRVVGNATADRKGQVYANPIRFAPGQSSATARDYYNALGQSILKQSGDPIGRLSPDTNELINILKENNPDYLSDPIYQDATQQAFDYCTGPGTPDAPPDANFCSESANPLSWGAAEFSSKIDSIIAKTKSQLSGQSAVAYFSKQNYSDAQKQLFVATAQMLHQRMPNTLKTYDDFILSTLTTSDLTDPSLALLRLVSPYLRSGVDTFVTNLLNTRKSSFTERLSPDGAYTVSWSDTTSLYSEDFRKFIDNIKTTNALYKVTTVDPLITLVEDTDKINISECSTGNPLSNPMCVKIASIVPGANDSISNAQVAFCSDTPNVSTPNCITHINGNQKVYNMNDINTKMLNYCLSADGQSSASCKPFSAIDGSDQWLINSTKNTTDSAGVTKTVCGTPGNLSTTICQKVCTAYPSLCESDIEKKCSAPSNRYSTNVDFFSGGQTEHLESQADSAESMLYAVLILIAFMFIVALLHSKTRTSKWNPVVMFTRWRDRRQKVYSDYEYIVNDMGTSE